MPPNPALAGTVVGVPPAGLGPSAGPPPAPPAPPPGYGAAPNMGAPGGYGAPPDPGMGGQPAFGGAAAGPPQQGFAPPGGPQAVNPLGGTMAIDQMPFELPPAGGAPPAAFPAPGAPPPGGGFGAPGMDPNQPYGQQQPGGYGAPQGGPAPYGAPPDQQGMGGQPGGYGAPQGGPAPYGAPQGGQLAPAGQFGMQGAPSPYAAMGQPGAGGMAQGNRGKTRNPIMVLVLANVTCGIYGIIAAWQMLSELKDYTKDESFKPFYLFIPVLGMYFALIKVPEQVGKAKQMAGCRTPQRGFFFYWFLWLYALAADLNEVWEPNKAS